MAVSHAAQENRAQEGRSQSLQLSSCAHRGPRNFSLAAGQGRQNRPPEACPGPLKLRLSGLLPPKRKPQPRPAQPSPTQPHQAQEWRKWGSQNQRLVSTRLRAVSVMGSSPKPEHQLTQRLRVSLLKTEVCTYASQGDVRDRKGRFFSLYR